MFENFEKLNVNFYVWMTFVFITALMPAPTPTEALEIVIRYSKSYCLCNRKTHNSRHISIKKVSCSTLERASKIRCG